MGKLIHKCKDCKALCAARETLKQGKKRKCDSFLDKGEVTKMLHQVLMNKNTNEIIRRFVPAAEMTFRVPAVKAKVKARA